ncbi:MAG: 4'-phosphopantetheinyl transferase superfamily protein [Gammaproteobacteria bacterium]|nr:4'-phosphopantetheinyl transferase superfamily protein [Gammaproteobacteria bacterium]
MTPAPDNPQWLPGPARPTEAFAGVDVWRVAGPVPRDAAGGMRGHAAAALREILRRYLPADVDDIEIQRQPGGKPRLRRPAAAGIEFNLSHCADLALVAVGHGDAVGVDVERQRRIDDPLRLARRVFPADQLARLADTADSRRAALFLELWTRLEARQKTAGRGIFAPPVDAAALACVSFRPTPAHIACVCRHGDGKALAVRFYDFDPQAS